MMKHHHRMNAILFVLMSAFAGIGSCIFHFYDSIETGLTVYGEYWLQLQGRILEFFAFIALLLWFGTKPVNPDVVVTKPTEIPANPVILGCLIEKGVGINDSFRLFKFFQNMKQTAYSHVAILFLLGMTGLVSEFTIPVYRYAAENNYPIALDINVESNRLGDFRTDIVRTAYENDTQYEANQRLMVSLLRYGLAKDGYYPFMYDFSSNEPPLIDSMIVQRNHYRVVRLEEREDRAITVLSAVALDMMTSLPMRAFYGSIHLKSFTPAPLVISRINTRYDTGCVYSFSKSNVSLKALMNDFPFEEDQRKFEYDVTREDYDSKDTWVEERTKQFLLLLNAYDMSTWSASRKRKKKDQIPVGHDAEYWYSPGCTFREMQKVQSLSISTETYIWGSPWTHIAALLKCIVLAQSFLVWFVMYYVLLRDGPTKRELRDGYRGIIQLTDVAGIAYGSHEDTVKADQLCKQQDIHITIIESQPTLVRAATNKQLCERKDVHRKVPSQPPTKPSKAKTLFTAFQRLGLFSTYIYLYAAAFIMLQNIYMHIWLDTLSVGEEMWLKLQGRVMEIFSAFLIYVWFGTDAKQHEDSRISANPVILGCLMEKGAGMLDSIRLYMFLNKKGQLKTWGSPVFLFLLIGAFGALALLDRLGDPWMIHLLHLIHAFELRVQIVALLIGYVTLKLMGGQVLLLFLLGMTGLMSDIGIPLLRSSASENNRNQFMQVGFALHFHFFILCVLGLYILMKDGLTERRLKVGYRGIYNLNQVAGIAYGPTHEIERFNTLCEKYDLRIRIGDDPTGADVKLQESTPKCSMFTCFGLGAFLVKFCLQKNG